MMEVFPVEWSPRKTTLTLVVAWFCELLVIYMTGRLQYLNYIPI